MHGGMKEAQRDRTRTGHARNPVRNHDSCKVGEKFRERPIYIILPVHEVLPTHVHCTATP